MNAILILLLVNADCLGDFDHTSRCKLLHNLEQFEFLTEADKLSRTEKTQELSETALPCTHRELSERIDSTEFGEHVPDHWDFGSFNSNLEHVEEHSLKPAGFASVVVPCKQNPVMIFNSFLFHKMDQCPFHQGCEN